MHTTLPKLNFPPIKLRCRRSEEVISAWDTLRRCYIVLTPEEWVRQHVVSFLSSQMAIPQHQIVVEYPVRLNNQNQRADVVVLDRRGEPTILVECKAAEVKIGQSTLDQAVRYNSIIGAKYLILTNGLTHHLYLSKGIEGEYVALSSFDEITL